MISSAYIESVEFTITIPTTLDDFILRHGCLKEHRNSFALSDYNVGAGSSVMGFDFAVTRYLISRAVNIIAGLAVTHREVWKMWREPVGSDLE